MRATDRCQEFPNFTEGNTLNHGNNVSPFEKRLNSDHQDHGGYSSHQGMDIAPPKPGQTNCPVYAGFAGTLRNLHRGEGQPHSTWAPQRIGDGGLISNPDVNDSRYRAPDDLLAFLEAL